MGWTFYNPTTAPAVFDIVWCKWPYSGAKLQPSDEARPVLVLDVRDQIYQPTGQIYADITIAYGTGAENIAKPNWRSDLVIGPNEFRAAGLHKPTIFRLDLRNRKRLPWCEKYFVPNDYVREQNIICGSLSEAQRSAALSCFVAQNLTFPLP
jgi:hypothetical protein